MAFALNAMFSRLFRPFSSNTMRYSPDGSSGTSTTTSATLPIPANAQKATVAGGCFWGVEHIYRKTFGGNQPETNKGLLDARVGYVGGTTKNPTYPAVCSGRTGHTEALQITFDPAKVSYRQLLEFFYKMHDPTTANRQGPDVGTQYRSGIYYHDDDQARIARDVTERVQKEWWTGGKEVSTEIAPMTMTDWWDAEAYHQKYLDLNPGGYECPSHYVRKFPPLSTD